MKVRASILLGLANEEIPNLEISDNEQIVLRRCEGELELYVPEEGKPGALRKRWSNAQIMERVGAQYGR